MVLGSYTGRVAAGWSVRRPSDKNPFLPQALRNASTWFGGFAGWFLGALNIFPRGVEITNSTESLKVSYEALDAEEKEVFLDIGCFLVGEEKELAIRVFEGLHDNSRIVDHLESLRQKCLVNFEYDVHLDDEMKYPKIGYHHFYLSITMHDQVKEFARHIAREEFRLFPRRNPLRLSSSKDMEEMLRSRAGSRLQIRGIRSWNVENQPTWNHNLQKITVEGVRLMVLEHESFETLFHIWERNMLGELVWLRLCRPSRSLFLCSMSLLKSFLCSMSLLKLRVVEIHGPCYEEVGPNEHPLAWAVCSTFAVGSCIFALSHIQPMPWTLIFEQKLSPVGFWLILNIIIIIFLLARSKSNFSPKYGICGVVKDTVVMANETLIKLVMRNLISLESLPIDFSLLPNLRRLDLSGCSQLTELPNTFPKLLQLQYLALQYCSKLSIPFDILGEISTLEYVDFKGCAKLVCLPDRIPYQRHLRYLNLLDTSLLKLPDNLGILDKLEQITIGSPKLKEIPLTVANMSGLTELFLIQCFSLKRILPEGIAAPNIKILAIDGCPIDNFSFQDQGNVDAQNICFRVGVSFLRDFILTNTSISQISIPDFVSPVLETIDLSGNTQLKRVNALPSTLVTLNLQNCWELTTLTCLSNLVNLKFLNRNRCFRLETLNLEGLASLEEIKAEGCWKLQRVEGLNQRERLNCLHISTDNRVIWNDICLYLRSPTHQKPSTAVFSGRADNYKICDKGDVLRIAKTFNLQLVDIFFHTTSNRSTFSVPPLNNFRSHSAILICFVTNNVKSHLRVTFTPAIRHNKSSMEYSCFTGNGGVHVFMWTEESCLFKEYSVYRKINVSFSPDKMTEGASSSNNVAEAETALLTRDVNSVEKERGWMFMVDKKTDVIEACRQFIMAWV